MPTCAEPSSAGVYATCTCTLDTLVVDRVYDPPLLLSASRPRDRSLVLGLRTPDLLRVHDTCARRVALSGPLGQAPGHPEDHRDRDARHDRHRLAPRERGDDGTDRHQRARLPSELAAGGTVNGLGNTIYEHGALYGPLVAHGDWWRLITSAFLHYGPFHLAIK